MPLRPDDNEFKVELLVVRIVVEVGVEDRGVAEMVYADCIVGLTGAGAGTS